MQRFLLAYFQWYLTCFIPLCDFIRRLHDPNVADPPHAYVREELDCGNSHDVRVDSHCIALY
jgi:hypothetical protein